MITPDSIHYINWTAGMCPIYPMFLALLKIFGGLQLYIAVALQVMFTLFAAWKFNKTLCIGRRWLALLSLAVACSPVLVWGHLIGSDILGYAFLLLGLAHFRKSKIAFFVFCCLATLTRFQYCFMFVGFFMDWKTLKYAIPALAVGVSLCCFCGFSGQSRLTIPANYVAKSGDIAPAEFERLSHGKHNFSSKPDRISHSAWFDKNLDFLGSRVEMKSPLGVIWKNRAEFAKLCGSKIYDAFRIHQLFVLLFMAAIPVPRIRFIVVICVAHYAEVILLSSLYFQRYTFMIEIPIACCIILLYDMLTSDTGEGL